MGNWPVDQPRREDDRPCLENGLVGEQRDRRLARRPRRRGSGPARAAPGPGCWPRSRRRARSPARSASPPAGRSRWRPSSSPCRWRRRRRRSGPGACRRARRRGRPGRCSRRAPWPGSSGPAPRPAGGSFGKSSAGSTRRWKLELPLRISTSCSASRDSISTVGVGQRAGDLGQQAAGQQHRALGRRPRRRASSPGPCRGRWRRASPARRRR